MRARDTLPWAVAGLLAFSLPELVASANASPASSGEAPASVVAAKKHHKKHHRKHHKKRKHKGSHGTPGPAGPPGSSGPPGSGGGGTGSGPGTGTVYPFNGLVAPNGHESVTVGQFTLSEVANGTTPYCNGVTLTNNSAYPAFVASGGASFPGAPNLPPGSSAVVAPADSSNNSFEAYVDNNSSSVAGTVSDQDLSSGCSTSGFIQGS